jgi:hypothetical protein
MAVLAAPHAHQLRGMVEAGAGALPAIRLPQLPQSPTAPDRRPAITANQLAGSNQDIPVSLSRLATLTREGSGMFWITVRGDQVVRIAEQWSP